MTLRNRHGQVRGRALLDQWSLNSALTVTSTHSQSPVRKAVETPAWSYRAHLPRPCDSFAKAAPRPDEAAVYIGSKQCCNCNCLNSRRQHSPFRNICPGLRQVIHRGGSSLTSGTTDALPRAVEFASESATVRTPPPPCQLTSPADSSMALGGIGCQSWRHHWLLPAHGGTAQVKLGGVPVPGSPPAHRGTTSFSSGRLARVGAHAGRLAAPLSSGVGRRA